MLAVRMRRLAFTLGCSGPLFRFGCLAPCAGQLLLGLCTFHLELPLSRARALLGLELLAACAGRLLLGHRGLPFRPQPALGRLLTVPGCDLAPVLEPPV